MHPPDFPGDSMVGSERNDIRPFQHPHLHVPGRHLLPALHRALSVYVLLLFVAHREAVLHAWRNLARSTHHLCSFDSSRLVMPEVLRPASAQMAGEEITYPLNEVKKRQASRRISVPTGRLTFFYLILMIILSFYPPGSHVQLTRVLAQIPEIHNSNKI